MSIADTQLAELKYESLATRKALERVPADKLGWKPHDKSMTLGRLASHIAEIPSWTVNAIKEDEFVVQEGFKPFNATDHKEIIAAFDKNLKEAEEALDGVSDEHMQAMWSMKMGDEELFSMPRSSVIRSWILNHLYHHRGQLTVYLRLNDAPVPSIYGPSADEQPQ